MAEKKNKNIFDKAIDALTDRDEKEEAAEKIKAEAKRAQVSKDAKARIEASTKAKAAEAKTKADAAAKSKAEAAAKVKATAEQKMARLKTERAISARQSELEKKRAEIAATKAATVKHVWTNEDTYASLAFEHYGSIKEAYWRLIYEHNKDIIGDHPNHIKTGTEIEIPPLPDNLKKK
jgi:hypothetical protein